MSTWEWIGLLFFVLATVLLFFAAFGGSKLTEQSVEDYMKRLLHSREERI